MEWNTHKTIYNSQKEYSVLTGVQLTCNGKWAMVWKWVFEEHVLPAIDSIVNDSIQAEWQTEDK